MGRMTALLAGLTVLTAAASASAGPTTQPGATVATSRPADAQDMQATVFETAGRVMYRPTAGQGGFLPVRKDMTLAAGAEIATGAKSHVVLSFADASVVALEALSIMSISEVYRSADAGGPKVTTRLKLVNGSVRAGVERGRTKSDFQIATPVATMAVRGTRPILLIYDSSTGLFNAYLGSEGLIDLLIKSGGSLTQIEPGERTDQMGTMPILLVQFDTQVNLNDIFGQTGTEYEVLFTTPGGQLSNFGGGNFIQSGGLGGGSDRIGSGNPQTGGGNSNNSSSHSSSSSSSGSSNPSAYEPPYEPPYETPSGEN